jgi:hypothetical protein
MIIDDVENLHTAAVCQPPVRDVGLPALIGQFGLERMKQLPGRFCGCGLTCPRRDKIRQMVATDGAAISECCRCHAMVCAPASKP